MKNSNKNITKIKILHVAYRYLPYIGGASLRLKSLIEPISKECELHVLVPKRELSGEKIYKNDLKDFEIINGVYVHRVSSVHNLWLATKKLCRLYKIDLIHVHNFRFAYLVLTTFSHLPLIYEIHAPSEYKMIKNLLYYYLCHRVNCIIVLSKRMKKYVREKYHVSENKVEVVYNGIKINKQKISKDKLLNIKRKLKLNNCNIIGYMGTLYDWQGVVTLVNIFPKIVDNFKNTKLLIVGDGPEKTKIQNIIKTYNLEKKIILTGSVLPEEGPIYLNIMDIIVIPRPSNIATETAIPLKVLEAMVARKPIVASRVVTCTRLAGHIESLL